MSLHKACCCGGVGGGVVYERCVSAPPSAPETLCLASTEPFIRIDWNGAPACYARTEADCPDRDTLQAVSASGCADPACTPPCTQPTPESCVGVSQATAIVSLSMSVVEQVPGTVWCCQPPDPFVLSSVVNYAGVDRCGGGVSVPLFENSTLPPQLVCECDPPSSSKLYVFRRFSSSFGYFCQSNANALPADGWVGWVSVTWLVIYGVEDATKPGGVRIVTVCGVGGNVSMRFFQAGGPASSPAGTYTLLDTTNTSPPTTEIEIFCASPSVFDVGVTVPFSQFTVVA